MTDTKAPGGAYGTIRTMRPMRLVVLLAVVLLPGVMLAPVWRNAGLGAAEDDILYYFPMRSLFGEMVRSGTGPWFNPWTGLGRPFMADPQTAVWYPATWLFAVLPPLQAYPISLWVHYSLALWGMYRLLRGLGLEARAALFGGISFAFCGFMLAHRAHFALQHAAAWTPWVFWLLHRYVTADAGGGGRSPGAQHASLRRLALAAAVVALQCFAGHVQVAAMTAVGALVFVLAAPAAGGRGTAGRAGLASAAGRWLLVYMCAAGLFAIQWLPTFAYVRVCTRVERTYLDFVENSWHPASVLDWTMPMLFGQRTPNFFDQRYWGPSHQVEQFAYGGILPLLLAALAVRAGWRGDARRRAWVVVGALGLLLALGQYGPVCPLLYWVPGSSLFRCPARALLLVNLAAAGLAAVALHDVGSGSSPQHTRLRVLALGWSRRPVLVGALLVAVPLGAIAAAMPFVDAATRGAAWHALRPWGSAVWVPLLTAIVALGVLGLAARRWRQSVWSWLIVLLTMLDLGVIGWTIDVPRDVRDGAALITPRTTDWLDRIRAAPHRLWVVTGRQGRAPGEYVDPVDKAVANTNILRGIETLTDYGPLQPRVVVARFGFKPWGETDVAGELLDDTAWMRLYDVGWILLCDADRPAPAGCELWATTPEGWRLFANSSATGPALVEQAEQPGVAQLVPLSATRFTTLVDTWPARVASHGEKQSADEPGDGPRLVVSRLALPGWTARAGDQVVPIETVDGVLMGVRVPPGEAAEVAWSYFPPGLYLGAGVSVLSVAVLAWAVLRGAR